MRRSALQAVVLAGVVVACVTPASAETINDLRSANGLAPLHVSGRLAAIAHPHAVNMARHSAGRCTMASLTHNGFFEVRGPAGAMAENVGCGCNNATCAIASWMKSPGHRANILLRSARAYGISHATTADGKVAYWVMLLGSGQP